MTDQSSSSENVAAAFGYLTINEVRTLKYLCKDCVQEHYPTFVNIGAGAGTSSLAMSEANPSAKIISIDISPGGPLGGLEGERNAFNAAKRSPPIQIQGDSHKIAASWPKNQKIDLLFIDDGHLENEIRGDIEGWLPHVREGGIVAFHDYGSPNWPDVKKVVDEKMLGKYQIVAAVDTLIAFKV